MKRLEDLDQLEARIYRSTFDDGLIDVFVGLVVSGFGIFMVTGNFAVMTPVYGLPLLWPLIRKRCIVPRMGYVRFADERRKKERRSLSNALFVGVCLLVAVAAAAITVTGRWKALGVHSIGLLFVLLMLMIVLTLHIRRFAVYAGLMLLAAAAGVAFDLSAEIYVSGIGAVMVAAGAAMLWRFARTHPANRPEEPHAAG